jgi:hypothetical protein
VIIDITGVKQVDASVASTLVKAAQGLRLLGTQVVLGYRPRGSANAAGIFRTRRLATVRSRT